MKITCNHCGSKNELGRMFCMTCGKRMQITNTDVDQAAGETVRFKGTRLVKPLLVIALLGLLVAALIPYKTVPMPTDASRRLLSARVNAKYNQLIQNATSGARYKETIDQDELNGFIRARRIGSATNQPLLSLELNGDRLVAVQPILFSPGKNVGPFRFTRRVVYAANGRVLTVTGASFGHLPLPGPLAKLATGPVAQAFVLTPTEQNIEKKLTELHIRDGKLEIVLGQ